MKTITLRNTTGSDIELAEIGETIFAIGGSPQLGGSPLGILDVSHYTAAELRIVTNLETAITNGDIVVNDGSKDLDAETGVSYVENDVVSSEDDFWYAKRRRFGIIGNKPSHGFVVGESISIDTTGSPPTQEVVSVNSLLDGSSIDTFAMVSEVIDADTFYAAFSGEIEGIDPSIIEGSPTALDIGRTYFLSQNSGKMTNTSPTDVGLVRKSIGLAVNADTLLMTTTPAIISPFASVQPESPTVGQLFANSAASVATVTSWKFPVLNRTVTDPSTLTPSSNDRHIVAAGAIGAWAGMDNSIVTYSEALSAWIQDAPVDDWFAFVVAEDANVRYNASGSPIAGWEIYPKIEQLGDVFISAAVNNNTLKFTTSGSPPVNKWINVVGIATAPAGSSGVIQLFWGPISGISGTTKIPKDNTTPLITEGTEIWSQTITPTEVGSPHTTVRVRSNFTFSSSNAALELVIAVFRDNNCIGVGVTSTSDNNSGFAVSTSFYDPSSTPEVEHTYSARVGRTGNNGTWFINQISGDTDAFPFAGSPIPGFLVEQNAFLVEEIGTNE